MPSTVPQLRVAEHATIAYILLLDGLPIAFTSDDSGELTGSGANSFIGRAEADEGETVGGRELRRGLIVPQSLEFGGGSDSLGLEPTRARFSVLDEDGQIARLFSMAGEEPEELLARLAPFTNPAPATVIGVTVRDRYIGLERIGPAGERRMFPALMGQGLTGLDHQGDADGALMPASVSERPLVHEGRMAALYRVYRDPSAISTSNSDAWPSLSEYRPIWVGKVRDVSTITVGERFSVECTGFESLLERNMAVGASAPFGIVPTIGTNAGVDDQVAVWFGRGPQIINSLDVGLTPQAFQGRDWTTLAGSTRNDVQASLDALLSDTASGVGADYETGENTLAVEGGSAGINATGIFVQRAAFTGFPREYFQARIAMHRRRWLLLGFDPEQQDHVSGQGVPVEDDQTIEFRRLSVGDLFEPSEGVPDMGAVPGGGYYMGVFTTIKIGGASHVEDSAYWDNDGAPRMHRPLFPAGDPVLILQPDGDQILRLQEDAALIPQSHVPRSGSIDGTDTDAAGYFLLKGRIRRAEGSTDDASLIVADDEEQVAIARCSWIVRDDYFADIGAGALPQLYVEQLHDPRVFGYPYKPLDRDWATLELQAVQLHTWALGTAGTTSDRADQLLSAMLRSTGTSTGPDPVTLIIDQGENGGGATGFFGDVFTAPMGLGIPADLCPPQTEITEVLATQLPNGAASDLVRMRPAYESSFSSFDVLRAILEPRGVRMGFDGARLSLYRLSDASPEDATITINESDLYGDIADPTSVWPTQEARALPPIDAWRFSYATFRHEQRAVDPGASTRRGDNIRDINARGLLAPELWGDEPASAPFGTNWKNDARVYFGDTLATFLSRRHGKITITVSRPKGQDIYPGTVVLLSNPWPVGADGTRGLSSVVGRVIRAVHNLRDASTECEILVFEGQDRPPPLYAPFAFIDEVTSSTQLRLATSNVPTEGPSSSGWVQPPWSAAGAGDAVLALWRMLADGSWAEVGTAPVASIDGTHINLSAPLSALPPDGAYTMIATLSSIDDQPEWAQEIYSGVAIPGDPANSRRFV